MAVCPLSAAPSQYIMYSWMRGNTAALENVLQSHVAATKAIVKSLCVIRVTSQYSAFQLLDYSTVIKRKGNKMLI